MKRRKVKHFNKLKLNSNFMLDLNNVISNTKTEENSITTIIEFLDNVYLFSLKEVIITIMLISIISGIAGGMLYMILISPFLK